MKENYDDKDVKLFSGKWQNKSFPVKANYK
jgi:hypothetical protein